MKESEAADDARRQWLHFGTGSFAAYQRLQDALDEAGDFLAVAALVGLAELSIQGWQLPVSAGDCVLACVGNRCRPDVVCQRRQQALKGFIHSLAPRVEKLDSTRFGEHGEGQTDRLSPFGAGEERAGND